MLPPSPGTNLDIEAVSGICGSDLSTPDFVCDGETDNCINRSISIACWVVVFSPQIIENFRRRSADGLSLLFIIVWLAGDVFNILGAVLQGVLPTMVILAVYYTLADIVLLGQCFYYRGFTLSDYPTKSLLDDADAADEDEPLLSRSDSIPNGHTIQNTDLRPHSQSSNFRSRLTSVDGTHLSPATPLIAAPKPTTSSSADPPATQTLTPTTTAQAILLNTFAIILVCAAGVFGWWVSHSRHRHHHHRSSAPSSPDDDPTQHFDPLGQTFGYLCAALYLGSRIPQILLNFRRQSTEGVSLLFFLFACLGNLTYVLSILAYDPACTAVTPYGCSGRYARYVLVNLSWLVGSAGTLLLDLVIFAQFFAYRGAEGKAEGEGEGEGGGGVDEAAGTRGRSRSER